MPIGRNQPRPDDARDTSHISPDPARLADLRAISLRSATRLHAHAVLTDADLYDENGHPA